MFYSHSRFFLCLKSELVYANFMSKLNLFETFGEVQSEVQKNKKGGLSPL
nr:MAG TPA: hypothetical protein [Caudoviricetes sp.]